MSFNGLDTMAILSDCPNLKDLDEEHITTYEKELNEDKLLDRNGDELLNSKDGEPYDHVTEAENLARRIQKSINKLKNAQNSPAFQTRASDVTKKVYLSCFALRRGNFEL